VQYEGTDPAEKTLAIPAVDKVGSFAYTTGDPNAVQLCDLLAERDAQIIAMAEELREAEADNVMAIAHLATTNALDTGANWAAQSAVIEAMSQQLEEAEEQAHILSRSLLKPSQPVKQNRCCRRSPGNRLLFVMPHAVFRRSRRGNKDSKTSLEKQLES